MRWIVPFFLIAALPGCANFATTVTADATAAANAINTVTAAASSPNATQAAANLKAGAQAVLCDVGNIAAVANQVEQAVRAGKVLIQDTQDVYAATAIVCTALGGQVLALNVTVPPTATTAVPK